MAKENSIKMKREIEEDTNKWKYILCPSVELTSLKCPHYPKQSRFNAILIKIPMAYITDLEQIFQKFIWNHKQP